MKTQRLVPVSSPIELLVIVCLFVLLPQLSSATLAQTFTGTIVGTATDRTGGVLPNATVSFTSVDTGLTRSVQTSSTGAYTAPLLPPGEYRLEAKLTGFKKFVQTGIHVEVNEDAKIDITLEVGDVTNEVTVRADTPLVQTQSAAVGTVVDNKKIVELPLNGRDFFQLSVLVPGAVPPAERSQNSTQGGAVSVNGAREQSNNFLLDGVDNNDLLINHIVVQPSVDTVQEFKLQSSTYAAEFGRSAGGQFNFVTKSGTNSWRGSLYEFFRNSALDAKNFFDDNQKPIPDFNRNQFGATLGGPLRINRTFFFANYEGVRAHEAFTRVATVPPAAWLRGDFSAALTGRINPATGLDFGQIFDPRTFQPIPGNRIPSNLLNPAGVALAHLYPAPDDPNALGPTTATVQPVGDSRNDQFTGRIDHVLADGSQLFGRYTRWQERRENPFDPFADPTNVPGFGSLTINRNHALAVGFTKTMGTRAFNDLRFGWNRYNGGIFQEHTDDLASALGIRGLTTVPGHAGRPGVLLGITDPLLDPYNTPQDRSDTTSQIIESFTWQSNRHSWKVGGDFRHFALDYYLDLFARGQLTFVGLSGNPVADLLMGVPTVAMRMNPALNTNQNVRSSAITGYLQDDWRVSDFLTLNAGLRYEYFQPPYDTQNRFSVPDFSSPTGAFLPVGTNGIPRSGFEADRNNFAPRIGAAWQPTHSPSMVVRGGYGIFYDAGILNLNIFPRYDPPNFALDLFIGPRPIENAFSGSAIPLTLANGIDRHYRDSYYHHFNVGLQRKIAEAMVIDVAYVGSRGRNLQLMRDLNQGPPGGPPFRNPTFGPARIGSSSGSSTYDSLQVRVDRQFVRGLAFLAAYTRSRSIDDGSSLFGSKASTGFPQDSFNVDAERGPSDVDTPHRLVVSSIWELPLGTGHRFFNAGPLAATMSGWEVTGILTYQSGRPFTVYYGPSANYSLTDNGANGGAGLDRPNLAGDPRVTRDPTRWFDPKAFTPPARGTFGNVGRNTLRGDSIQNVDLGVYKRVRIRRADTQVRMEIFNALNRSFFFLPIADLTNASAGRVTRAGDARKIQLGVKIAF
jgi:carboxypeptidase family protein/TonB-dependent receptor-like protein